MIITYIVAAVLAVAGWFLIPVLEVYFTGENTYRERTGKTKWIDLAACLVIFPGTAFFVKGLYGESWLVLGKDWILLYMLYMIAVIDFRQKIIPNGMILWLFLLRAVLLFLECITMQNRITELLLSSVAGLALAAAMFFVARLVAKEGIGMGDVKLAGVLGFYLGMSVFISDMILTMGFLVITGLILLLLKKVRLRSELSFAPFVFAGTLITILLGFI